MPVERDSLSVSAEPVPCTTAGAGTAAEAAVASMGPEG